MDSITVISNLSFFKNSPGIRSYHSCFFHGIAHRNGEWSPWETKGMDANTGTIPTLSIWSNQYYVPHYCHPGSWPVVSEAIRESLCGVSSVKFLPVIEERAVDYAWRVGEPINIEPGALSCAKLLERLPSVEPTKLGKRYEMVSFRYHKIIGDYDAPKLMRIECGSPPSPVVVDYEYSNAILDHYPVHWVAGSMVFRKEYWERIESLIDKPFFNIRTYELEFD